jgi:MFS family permease
MQQKENPSEKGYKHIHVPRDIFALLTNRVLFRLGFGLIGVFLPIFFYELFGSSLYALLGIYILLYILGIIIMPLTARLLQVVGIRGSLLLAIPPAGVSIGALYYADTYPVYATAVFIITMALYQALYWVPYHTDLAKLITGTGTGRHLALYKNVLQIINAATPLIGGLLLISFGFGNIFLVATVILFTTITPTLLMVQVYERYEWGFFETFKHFFNKKNRPLLYAYMADGAQSVVSAVVWPVFIFELLDGNYASVGFVTSLTIIFILILNVAVGRFIEKVGEGRALKYSTILATTGWILKIFVESSFQIFITDTYHQLGRAANRMSFDTATYDHTADSGHYMDEFTTLKEMALRVGRILMLIAVAALLYMFGNIRAVFIIAAGATLFMVLINKQMKIR